MSEAIPPRTYIFLHSKTKLVTGILYSTENVIANDRGKNRNNTLWMNFNLQKICSLFSKCLMSTKFHCYDVRNLSVYS